MKKDAITVLELLITIIIIGILAAIAVPSYRQWVINERVNRAITYIETIIVPALKDYYIRNEAEPAYSINGLANINSTLGLEIPPHSYFTYTIEKPAGQEYCDIRADYTGGGGGGGSIQYNLGLDDGDPDGWLDNVL